MTPSVLLGSQSPQAWAWSTGTLVEGLLGGSCGQLQRSAQGLWVFAVFVLLGWEGPLAAWIGDGSGTSLRLSSAFCLQPRLLRHLTCQVPHFPGACSWNTPAVLSPSWLTWSAHRPSSDLLISHLLPSAFPFFVRGGLCSSESHAGCLGFCSLKQTNKQKTPLTDVLEGCWGWGKGWE